AQHRVKRENACWPFHPGLALRAIRGYSPSTPPACATDRNYEKRKCSYARHSLRKRSPISKETLNLLGIRMVAGLLYEERGLTPVPPTTSQPGEVRSFNILITVPSLSCSFFRE